MKIDLLLKEDEKLRKEVLKLIEGQVKSILRSEIKNIVLQTIAGSSNKFTAASIEQIMNLEIKQMVERVSSDSDGTFRNTKVIERIIRFEVSAQIEKQKPYIKLIIEKYVKEITKETLSTMIDDMVSKKVKSTIATLLK